MYNFNKTCRVFSRSFWAKMLLIIACVFAQTNLLAQWTSIGSNGFSSTQVAGTSLVIKNNTPYLAYIDHNGTSSTGISVVRFNGTTWENVGAKPYTGTSNTVSLVFNGDVPYIAFCGGSLSNVSVMRLNGAVWEYVGTASFSPNNVSNLSLAFEGTTPYIAFPNNGAGVNKGVVMRFNGTAWERIIASDLTPYADGRGISNLSLALQGTTPYLAYCGDNGQKANVVRFNGTAWETVGATAFSTNTANSIKASALKFVGTTPYLAFQELASSGGSGNVYKASLMRYTGTAWEYIGTPQGGNVGFVDLGFDGTTPYLGYNDYTNLAKAVVKKYTGTAWQSVGVEGFSASEIQNLSLALNGSILYMSYQDVSFGNKATVKQYCQSLSTPSVSITLTSGTNPNCSGTSVTFTATPTNAGANPSYQWKKEDANVGTNSPTYTDAGTTSGVISCIMTVGTGVCSTVTTATSTTLSLSVKSVLNPILASTNGNCIGNNNLTLTGAETATQIEWQKNNVTVFTSNPTVGITVAGGNGVGSAANQLTIPMSVYVDNSGNIYVADQYNHRIQKWAFGARVGTTVAGGNGIGSAANQLSYPSGVYVDGSGNIYVADEGNYRIQKWAIGASVGTTVAGGNGQGSAANQLSYPTGVYVDGSGHIYVADQANNRIQKWVMGASVGTTVAGGNEQGFEANQFYSPSGVYVDGSGNIYVADQVNHRIQKWAIGASVGTTVAGGNGQGSAANQLFYPTGVYVDGSGNIYIAEQKNHRIQKWVMGASIGTTLAGGNGQGAAANQFSEPTGLYVDGSNNIYVADRTNHRIQKWLSASTYTTYTPTSPGTYTTIVTASNGCISTSNSIIINPIVTPSVSIAASATTICVGTSVTFTPTPTNGGTTPTYIWKKNGTSVATTPTYTATDLVNNDVVTCQMTTNALCLSTPTVSSPSLTMIVNALPSVSITANKTVLCSGDTATLTASTGVIYKWSNTQTTKAIKVAPSVKTTYTVSVTDNNGCTGTSNQAITVNPRPKADFAFTISGGTAKFTNLSAGETTYNWTFKNDSTSTTANPTTTYRTNGIYTVCLLISNSFSCRDSICKDIRVTRVAIDDLPNGLTYKIGPNPTTGIIDVYLFFNQIFKNNDRLIVSDLLGRKVIVSNNLTQHNKLDISSVANGTYLIQLAVDNKVYTLDKIVKSN